MLDFFPFNRLFPVAQTIELLMDAKMDISLELMIIPETLGLDKIKLIIFMMKVLKIVSRSVNVTFP